MRNMTLVYETKPYNVNVSSLAILLGGMGGVAGKAFCHAIFVRLNMRSNIYSLRVTMQTI